VLFRSSYSRFVFLHEEQGGFDEEANQQTRLEAWHALDIQWCSPNVIAQFREVCCDLVFVIRDVLCKQKWLNVIITSSETLANIKVSVD